MPEIEYTPGLKVRWTEKELDKIREIKNRLDRKKRPATETVPDYDLDEIRIAEKKRQRNIAICSLHDYGWSIIEIAELFNIKYNEVWYIVHREGRW